MQNLLEWKDKGRDRDGTTTAGTDAEQTPTDTDTDPDPDPDPDIERKNEKISATHGIDMCSVLSHVSTSYRVFVPVSALYPPVLYIINRCLVNSSPLSDAESRKLPAYGRPEIAPNSSLRHQ